MEQWHTLSADEAIKKLESSLNGLTEAGAQKRLAQFGPNEIEKERTANPAKIFLSQFSSPLVIILIIAAMLSYFISEGILDTAIILVIVVLNAVLGFVQEYRAEKAIEALEKLTTPSAVVIRDGKERKVQTKDIVPGDIIILEAGDKIPADCRAVAVVSLKADEASLTGESVPVSKQVEKIAKETILIAEKKNCLFMGTSVTYGRGTAVATTTGMNTEIGRIAHLIQTSEEEKTPLQKNLKTFSKNLTALILVISLAVIITGLLRGGILSGLPETELRQLVTGMIITGIALAVAAIPEGLPAIVTITLAIGLQKLSKQNALIRKLPAVETLGSVTVICSDKTGTLTKNEMTVEKVFASGSTISVTGYGYSTSGEFFLGKRKINPVSDRTLGMLLTAGALCNNAKTAGTEEIIGDPTEGSMAVLAAKAGISTDRYPREGEIPFSSERKMMTTLHRQAGQKTLVASKGAPEVILRLCDRISKNGTVSVLSPIEKNELLEVNKGLADEALRVLAVAYSEHNTKPTENDIEKGLIFLGFVGMIDPPREGVKEDIELCEKAGIKVVMITGDHKNTAVAIANQLNILKQRAVLTGEEIESLSDAELHKVVENTFVYARVNPEHKARILSALKKNNHTVAMTGDGVNDAPALKRADIGIAMGIKGTEVAKEASGMILKDDHFSSIVSAVSTGRAVYDNIKKFIQYLLSSNIAEVSIVVAAMMIGFSDQSGSFILPITAIQLLWINLLTDGLPALALGLDPPAHDIMNRPPRNPREGIFTKETVTDIIFVAAAMTAGILLIFSSEISDPAKARTMAFTGIVVLELFRAQATRLKYNIRFFANRKLSAAIAASLLLQIMVIYIPALQPAFGTKHIGLFDWIKIISVGAAFFLLYAIKTKATHKKHAPTAKNAAQ